MNLLLSAKKRDLNLFRECVNEYMQAIWISGFRSSHPEVFLRKAVLKICSKCTKEHPCQSVISIKLLCNFIEIKLWHRCSPVNFLHIFRIPFPRNTSGWLLLRIDTRENTILTTRYLQSRKQVVASKTLVIEISKHCKKYCLGTSSNRSSNFPNIFDS